MPGPFVMLIYALAIARVTAIITTDSITERQRVRVGRWLLDRNKTLLYAGHDCPWCWSVWISAIAAPLIYYQGNQPWLLIPALWMALSEVAGLAAKARG